MKIIEPGHVYELNWLDGSPDSIVSPTVGPVGGKLFRENRLIFVCREDSELLHPHAGTQTQEVIRALIDRTMHCDNCLRWPGNDEIIHHLRMALALHEARALGRKTEKGLILPERISTGPDGHFSLTRTTKMYDSYDAQQYQDSSTKNQEARAKHGVSFVHDSLTYRVEGDSPAEAHEAAEKLRTTLKER